MKVFLEIKKKYRGLVNKRRTILELGEAYDFIETGVKPELQDYMNGQVLNELEYCLNLYDLEPKVYIAYDRLAYFEKGNDEHRRFLKWLGDTLSKHPCYEIIIIDPYINDTALGKIIRNIQSPHVAYTIFTNDDKERIASIRSCLLYTSPSPRDS